MQEAEWETETNETYEEWLRANFGHVASSALGQHHHRLWRWFANLKTGVRPRPLVEIWPRGGAKSSTAELGSTFLGTRRPLQRRFVLYACGTQEQADLHVKAIASLLEQLSVERSTGRYGNSKGWRRDQLITNSGFAVAGFGLDVASRGVKIENYRPDLIIFDDVDSQDDTPKTVAKKISAITTKILPTGSADAAILFIQNLIHEEGVVAQLFDGRAEFLHDREVPPPVVAVKDMKTELVQLENGANAYKIVEGEASWTGQSIEVCERQITDWGIKSFLREAQHDVQSAEGYFFNSKSFREADFIHPDSIVAIVRGWDLAATQDGGDYTAGVLVAKLKNNQRVVLDVVRAQLSSDNVNEVVSQCAELDDALFKKRVRVVLPQDPGQAGKAQATAFQKLLKGRSLAITPVSGKKAVRARGWADVVNSGNALLYTQPVHEQLKQQFGIPLNWIRDFKEEHRKFREDEEHLFDDQVDAAADSENELAGKSKLTAVLV